MALLWLQDLDRSPGLEDLGSGPAKGRLPGLWQAVFLAVFVLGLPAVVGIVLVLS